MHVTEIETLHFANLTQYPMPRNVTSTDFRPSRRSHLLNIILRVGLCPKCVLVSGVLSEWGFVQWGFVRVGFCPGFRIYTVSECNASQMLKRVTWML